jgi:hypothetical protein
MTRHPHTRKGVVKKARKQDWIVRFTREIPFPEPGRHILG